MSGEDRRYTAGELLFRDDFPGPRLGDWVAELEGGAGRVEAKNGKLTIDVPKGATVWFRHELVGPVCVEYEATAVAKGGPNDRVSDLNCFWMATDPRGVPCPDARRGGAFAEYDSLRCYYVGLGGNANTTTRFRRYVGEPGNRPLLPEHDLTAPQYLLKANARQAVRLIACGGLIQYWRDGRKLFELDDPRPYTRGWFALRTVASHLEVERFRVRRLKREES
jgi:hypothetical protein